MKSNTLLLFFFSLFKSIKLHIKAMFDELNQSRMKEEPNPFEQSFASARSSKFEFVQYKWDTCSYKSSSKLLFNAINVSMLT
jgi:hypothetical protein